MRREDAIPQHFGVITQHPDTAVAFERLRDGGGFAAQRPVGEDLHRPDAQEVVTEATAHAEIETHQLVGERMQCLGGGHQFHAHVQLPALPGELIGGRLGGAVSDPAPGDTRLGDMGESFGDVHLGRSGDGLDELLHRVRLHQRVHQLLCLLREQPRRLPRSVPLHDSALGHDSRIVEDPGLVQNGAADHTHVRRPMLQPHRTPTTRTVQRGSVGVPAQHEVVILRPDHPRVGRLPGPRSATAS